MKTLPVIQGLWIGNSLSTMEKLSILSFLKNGHPFHLYIYDDLEGVPEGTILKDASKVLTPDRIFKYKTHNSYAGFANLFRYKLLHEKGNYWVDIDIICLRPFVHTAEHVFASQRQRFPRISYKRKDRSFHELRKTAHFLRYLKKRLIHWRNKISVTNCLIKAPSGSAIMDYCYNESLKRDPEKLTWGETGPKLLNKAVKKFKMQEYVVNPELFCPVDFWNWEQVLSDSPGKNLLTDSDAIHLWNEKWRRSELDKSHDYSTNCIYERLKDSYLIQKN